MAAPKYSRVQEKGQVTIPIEIRRKLGLEKGDLVAFEERDEDVVVVPKKVVPLDQVGDIGDLLERAGLSLDDLIEAGREERTQILKDIYGYTDADLRE